MSRYFNPYDVKEDPTYPEDVRYIRLEIESNYGELSCSNKKLGELWRDFCDDAYCAGFLNPNPELIEEFTHWLSKDFTDTPTYVLTENGLVDARNYTSKSDEEEYIKKEDTLKMVEQNKEQICIYRAIESLPTYSVPDSAKPKFEKVMDDIHANKGKEVVIVSDSAENLNMEREQAYYRGYEDGIQKGRESAFEGMTNREIISEFVERDDSFAIMVDEVNGTVNIELSLDFWNNPYQKRENPEEVIGVGNAEKMGKLINKLTEALSE